MANFDTPLVRPLTLLEARNRSLDTLETLDLRDDDPDSEPSQTTVLSHSLSVSGGAPKFDTDSELTKLLSLAEESQDPESKSSSST